MDAMTQIRVAAMAATHIWDPEANAPTRWARQCIMSGVYDMHAEPNNQARIMAGLRRFDTGIKVLQRQGYIVEKKELPHVK